MQTTPDSEDSSTPSFTSADSETGVLHSRGWFVSVCVIPPVTRLCTGEEHKRLAVNTATSVTSSVNVVRMGAAHFCASVSLFVVTLR